MEASVIATAAVGVGLKDSIAGYWRTLGGDKHRELYAKGKMFTVCGASRMLGFEGGEGGRLPW